MNSIELPNDFNLVKVGRTVTFMKYLASVVSLLSLAKILISNKIMLPSSNSLSLTELVLNEPMRSIYKKKKKKKKLPIFLFIFDLSLLNVKISRAYK